MTAAPDWRAEAACLDRGNTAWFDPALELQAKAICAGCPVRRPCREYALACGPDLHGVWGGQTRAERLRTRQRHQPIKERYETTEDAVLHALRATRADESLARPDDASCG